MFIHYFCKMEGKTVFNNQKDDFKTIRDILLKLRYDFYYYNISGFPNYYFNPYQLEENILLKLENYNIEIQTVFKFLLLGYAMPLNEVSEDLKTIIIILHKYNIVVNDGLFYKMNNYSLISYSGYFFIVDMPSYYNNCNIQKTEVYIGIDTYRLSNIIPKLKNKRILDLCCGSGIQGITASEDNQVDFIEYNEKTIKITKINIMLNDIDCTNVYHSNLFEKIRDRKYDLILSNPPFIPVPQNLDYPIAGDGGESGLETLKKIFKGLDEHLNDEGISIIIGECLGDKYGHTILETELKKIFKKNYNIQLFLNSIIPKEIHAKIMSNIYSQHINKDYDKKTIENKWLDLYCNLKMDSYYSFTLFIQKSKFNKIEVIKNYFDWNDEMKPIVFENLQISLINDLYQVKNNNLVVSYIDKSMKSLLEKCNGKNKMSDLIDYNKISAEAYQNVLNILEEFYKNNLIKKG